MNRVEKIASNADEKPVQRTTSTKISQTWLASQTGPIAESIICRGRRPRSPPPASRLQSPAPKSAPAEDGVHRHPDEEHDGDGVGARSYGRLLQAAPRGERLSGPYGTSTAPSSPSRQRRDIARSVMINAAPRAA